MTESCSTTDSIVSFKEASDIYQKQCDGVHRLWTYFQVVSLAVLGYTIGSDKSHWQTSSYLILAFSYLVFALGNHWVLVLSQTELDKSADAVGGTCKKDRIALMLVPKPTKPRYVRAFHLTIILLVTTAIIVTWSQNGKICLS